MTAADVLTGGYSRPIPLDDPGEAWLVETGHFDVFAVAIDPFGRDGRRLHLFRVTESQWLIGCGIAQPDGRGASVRIIAIGSLGAQARWTVPDAHGIATWAHRVSRIVAHDAAPSAARAGEAPLVVLKQGERVAAAARGLLLMRVEAGTLRLPGGERLVAGDPPLALADPMWAEAEDAATVRFVEPDAPDVRTLALLHGLALGGLIGRFGAAGLAEEARAHERARIEQEALERGLGRLAGDLAAVPIALRSATSDPFGFAIEHVLHRLGEEMPGRVVPRATTLVEAATLRGLRRRRVLLRGDWRTNSEEPLIGLFGPERTPVALLPGKPWRIVGRDVDLPLDDAAEAELALEAWQLYRTLPRAGVRFRDLFRLGLRHSRADTMRLIGFGMAAALLGLALPKAMQFVFETVVPNGETGTLAGVVATLIALSVAIALFEMMKAVALLRIEARFETNASPALMDRLLRLPARFFRGYSVGDLADRLTGIQSARALLSGNVLSGMLGAGFGLSSLILLVAYDLRLAAVALLLASVTAAAGVCVSLAALKHDRARLAHQGQLDGFALQLVAGISKIRTGAAERRALAAWAERYADQRDRFVSAANWRATQMALMAILPTVSTAIILGMIAYFAQAGRSTEGGPQGFTAGTFIGFSAAFGQLMAAVSAFANALAGATLASPLIERAKPILEAPPETRTDAEPPGTLSGGIEVRKLSFAYATGLPRVLDEFDLRIEPGQFVALVGASGSGKSTLMRLLLGFEQPETGEILFDGKTAARLAPALLRRQIGVVLQNGRISSGSVYGNILGPAALGLDDAWTAARMVGLDKDIQEMPMGMYTALLDGGGTLSGGQRQRLLIARALVHQPRILLLDEATSALDNRTQAIVTDTLSTLNITRLVIAHRLSTIARVDRIFVVARGRVVQAGTYDELLAADGPFADLARRQMLD